MSFKKFLEIESKKEYYQNLICFVDKEREQFIVYPKKSDVFKAFHLTEFTNVKIVLLGQDPYHGPNQANGLAFSVNLGEKIPPSLRNIYKELNESLDFNIPNHGDLTLWAKRGMLLLNSTLTVRASEAASHSGKGWETFTDNVISYLSNNYNDICFILLGNYAKSKDKLIDTSKHKIVYGVHPSPLSAYRGFFGSNIFKEVKEYCNNFDFNLEEK